MTQPEPLALPRYAGELYVYVALVLGGIWMFATVPLIIMFGLVLVSEATSELAQAIEMFWCCFGNKGAGRSPVAALL